MPSSPPRHAAPDTAVCLMLHGAETSALGGPSVRVPRTVAALRDLGIAARGTVFEPTHVPSEDTVHVFNVWPPDSALRTLRSLKAAGKRVVFSPIFLDFSERAFWQDQLPLIAHRDADAIAACAATAQHFAATRGSRAEVIPGHHAMIRQMLDMVDHVVFLSTAERDALAHIGASVDDARSSLVHNPVDADLWQDGDPQLFHQTFIANTPGPQDYVICVGRIEERKNQLMLARALRDLPLRLVLVGHAGNPDYLARIEDLSQGRLCLVGRLAPACDMLRSALAGAQAFALPSWAEGAALAALEAAAAGTPLVLSDKSSERAYFGDLATYADPACPDSLRNAIQTAAAAGRDPAHRRAVQAHVRAAFGWSRHAQATAQVYAKTAKAPARKPRQTQASVPVTPTGLVVDLSALLVQPDQAACQMDAALLDALGDTAPHRICWSARHNGFVTVPPRFTDLDQALDYCTAVQDGLSATPAQIPQGCRIISFAHAGQTLPDGYAHGLADLKMRHGASVGLIAHDAEGLHPAFGQSTDVLVLFDLADTVWATSQVCARTVAQQCAGLDHDVPVQLLTPPAADLPAPDATCDIARRFGARRFVFAPCAGDALGRADMLVQIWARLARDHDHRDVHLILEGHPPQMALTLAQAQRLNIHVLEALTPQARSWLYATAQSVLYPSQRAGWALPVVRAQARGTPCLASTTAQAPQGVTQLDPEDFTGWHSALCASLAQAPHTQPDHIEPNHPGPEGAADLAQALMDPAPLRLASPVLVGQRIGTDKAVRPMGIHFGHGWQAAGTHGRWATGPTAQFGVDVSHCLRAGAKTLTLCLFVLTDVTGPDRAVLRLRHGADIVLELPLSQGLTPPALFITLPTDQLSGADLLRLTLALDAPGKAAVGLSWLSVLDPDLSNPLHCATQPYVWSAGDVPLLMDLTRDSHRAETPHLTYVPDWGAGRTDGVCHVFVTVLPGAGPQRLCVTLRPVATPQAPVCITLCWNGRVLTRQRFTSDNPQTITARLEAQDFATHGPGVLRLHSDSLQTPSTLGLVLPPPQDGPHDAHAQDDTVDHAGFGLFDLSLEPIAPLEDTP